MLLTAAEPVLCLTALLILRYRRQLGQYRFLGLLLGVRLTTLLICIPLLDMAGKQIKLKTFYLFYFPIYWGAYAIEAVLGLCIIYEIYRLAMAPLRGLQALGMLMFRWAAGIAVAVALGMAFGPHMTSQSFVIGAIRQLQQTQSILDVVPAFVCVFRDPADGTFAPQPHLWREPGAGDSGDFRADRVCLDCSLAAYLFYFQHFE